MIDDYMETYENYYSITPTSDKEKYNTIKEKNIDVMLRYISNVDEKSNLGMTQDEINLLKDRLTKNRSN